MPTIARLAFVALLASDPGAVLAQTAPQTNPLRPANSRSAQPPAAATESKEAETKEAETKTTEPKAKRPRSPAQLANDNRMRACGKEWRENKAKLAATGKTWRAFNVECRARMKAAGQ